MAQTSEWMTATEVAEYLGISKTLVSRLMAQGRVQWQKSELDQRIKMIRRADVEHLASQRRATRRKSA